MLKHRLSCATLLIMSLLASPLPAAAESLPSYPFVHAVGIAFREVMPDIAALDFEIVAIDADPAAARAVLEARVTETRELMRQLGLDPDDAAVREVHQNQRKGKETQADAPVYELRCDVHINVRDVSKWAALAGGLLGKPNLDGFSSAFDLSTMGQVNAELVTEAVLDARRRATVMAAADGRRLGAMMAATPQDLKNLSNSMGLERSEFRYQRGGGNTRPANADRDALLTVQVLKLSQPADVIFRLEGPTAANRR